MKNQKGITLIALVITIIVLLILAGVSIAMLTGQNGLLTKANSANEETQKATVRENVEVAISAAYTNALAEHPEQEVTSLTVAEIVAEIRKTNNYESTDTTVGTSGAGDTEKITYSFGTGTNIVTYEVSFNDATRLNGFTVTKQ